jgi:uncharacterized membrane protein
MRKYLGAWALVLLAMGLMDAVWIGWLARPLYQQGLGHLMAPQVQLVAAIAFYMVYGVGLLLFVVAADGASAPWGRTLWRGALFGFVAYAVYDLANLATLRDWPLGVALIDMAWGSLASAAAAAAGKAGFDRLSGESPGAPAG